MRRAEWITSLWPGLWALWWHGRWSGLAVAALFALLVNSLLLCTFVTVGLIPLSLVRAGWTLALAGWLAGGGYAWRAASRRRSGGASAHPDDLFLPAQAEYLKGHWFEAERLLRQHLRQWPADVDAGLMLASLLRHTRRYDLAREQLLVLERLEGAAKWRLEIEQERRWMEQSAAAPDTQSAGAAEGTGKVPEAA